MLVGRGLAEGPFVLERKKIGCVETNGVQPLQSTGAMALKVYRHRDKLRVESTAALGSK